MTDKHSLESSLDRDKLIEHAKIVLDSSLSGVELAEEMRMNVRQIYAYRKKRRLIENAYVDTLLKFEEVYKRNFSQ